MGKSISMEMISFCQENPVSNCPPNNDFMDMINIWIMDFSSLPIVASLAAAVSA
jgi:hypothetical protein